MLVEQAISEKTDETAYMRLLSEKMKNKNDKEIVRGISADGEKHRLMFLKIYENISGERYGGGFSPTPPDDTILRSFEVNIFNLSSNVEFYRKIYNFVKDEEIRDILFEIITDELLNMQKFSYLYSKYK
ncbi:hypothetical protein AGMMS49975_20910 [Clostridia bacterium]|nr:hypothetical protein AGMMS49975_20910 [Clostridia bacterium]GHU75628.1 hypothetical protein FACS1894188_06860 [Clostridia bacterium]